MYGGDSGSSSEDSEDEKQERKDSDSELRVRLSACVVTSVINICFEGNH